jgi:3-oxoacyl-[acyl-carrier protein] reductase
MVLGLARAGVHVIATAGREPGEIEAVAREAEESNGQASVVPLVADVTKATDCEMIVDAAVKEFGRLDILVNNAGRGMKYVSDSFMTEPTRFWEISPETWRLIIDTNVNGPFLMARSAAPVMIRTGWGRIINISVSQVTMRRRGFTPYGPSKAALESETIIWSQELEGTGVTVNALLPGGGTRTGMIPDSMPDEVLSNLLDPDIIVPPLIWIIREMLMRSRARDL